MLRVFVLPAILDDLAKQPVIVADAIAAGRDPECGHAVHEAGREPAEAAIAERRVGLGGAHPVEIDADVAERHPDGFAEPQVFDDIAEQAPDQEFQGQIIDALGAPGLGCPVGSEPAMDDPVAQRERGRDKPVAIGRRRRVLADGQGHFGENRGLEFIDVRLGRRHVANRRWHSRLRQILLPRCSSASQ